MGDGSSRARDGATARLDAEAGGYVRRSAIARWRVHGHAVGSAALERGGEQREHVVPWSVDARAAGWRVRRCAVRRAERTEWRRGSSARSSAGGPAARGSIGCVSRDCWPGPRRNDGACALGPALGRDGGLGWAAFRWSAGACAIGPTLGCPGSIRGTAHHRVHDTCADRPTVGCASTGFRTAAHRRLRASRASASLRCARVIRHARLGRLSLRRLRLPARATTGHRPAPPRWRRIRRTARQHRAATA